MSTVAAILLGVGIGGIVASVLWGIWAYKAMGEEVVDTKELPAFLRRQAD